MKTDFKIIIKLSDLKVRKNIARSSCAFNNKVKYTRKNKHRKDYYETKNI